MIGWRKDGSAGEYVDAAPRGWNATTLQLPAAKGRELEATARALELAALIAEALKYRMAADQQRQSLSAIPVFHGI